MQKWFVFSLFFSVVVVLFAVLNSDVVTIRLFWANYDLSQSLVILLSAAFGAIITIFLGLFSKLKSSLKIRELNSELVSANQQIELQRNSIKSYELKFAVVQNEKLKTESVVPKSQVE